MTAEYEPAIQPAPRLNRFFIRNYRSIGDGGVNIDMPNRGEGPLVLIGENNAGKSNILRAIAMLFGEVWPSSDRLEEHDHFGRVPSEAPIRIDLFVSHVKDRFGNAVRQLRWESQEEIPFSFTCDGEPDRKVTGELREQIFSLSLTSEFDIKHQLSYRNQWTMLSKLMRQFHRQLMGDETREQRLKKIYADTVSIFEEVEEFLEFKEALKQMSHSLTSNLQYALEFDFSAYDPGNYFRSLRIHPTEQDAFRSFDELGSGQQQLLMLAFAQAYAKAFRGRSSLILLCDEPETHLHPIAQRVIARSLVEASSRHDVQVIVSTHSPMFIDLSRIEHMVRVYKDPQEHSTVPLQLSREDFKSSMISPGEKRSKNQSGESFEAAATDALKSAMFSKAVVLTEGQTEPLAYPPLLRCLGQEFDSDRLGISIVYVGGIGSIPKWCRFFRTLKIPTYAIYDTDDWSPENERKRKSCWEALEGNPDDLPSAENIAGPLHVTDTAAIQHTKFEAIAPTLFGPRWIELQNEAIELLGSDPRLKPLQARYAAERIEFDEVPPEGVNALVTFGNVLRLLVGGSSIELAPRRQVEERYKDNWRDEPDEDAWFDPDW